MRALILACLLLGVQDRKLDQEALARINDYRKTAGLAPVELDATLSKGCTAHAKYLVKNDGHPSTAGLGAHEEDPKLPGYTPEGQKAGKSSDINFMPPPESVDSWMASFFHRVPILHPHLKKVGLGYAEGGKHGWVCVLDVTNGLGGGRQVPFVLYPIDKQQNVPLRFGGEVPNPIPEDTDGAGYPNTVTFPETKPVKKVEAILKDSAGKVLEVWLSSPEKPADERFQRHTVCVIAKNPFEPNTNYTITISGKVGGSTWRGPGRSRRGLIDRSWILVVRRRHPSRIHNPRSIPPTSAHVRPGEERHLRNAARRGPAELQIFAVEKPSLAVVRSRVGPPLGLHGELRGLGDVDKRQRFQVGKRGTREGHFDADRAIGRVEAPDDDLGVSFLAARRVPQRDGPFALAAAAAWGACRVGPGAIFGGCRRFGSELPSVGIQLNPDRPGLLGAVASRRDQDDGRDRHAKAHLGILHFSRPSMKVRACSLRPYLRSAHAGADAAPETLYLGLSPTAMLES